MKVMLVAALGLALAGCAATPYPLVPDTTQGPASYVCYSSMTSTPEEVRAIAERQCGRLNLGVTGLIGQSWAPMRCGALTPNVAAFQCGPGGYAFPHQ